MQKVDSPAPKTEYSPNWPARKLKLAALASSLKRRRKVRVSGVSSTIDFDHHEVGLVDAGGVRRRAVTLSLLCHGHEASSGGASVDCVVTAQDLGQVLAGGAGARAAAAAGAQHVAELERIDEELVLDALAVARVLVAAGVVARGVQREDAGLAGVPVAAAHAAAHALGLVDDVEAVAGGAHRGAHAAAVAARPEGRPEGIVEVVVEPVAQAAVVELQVAGDALAGRGPELLRPGALPAAASGRSAKASAWAATKAAPLSVNASTR